MSQKHYKKLSPYICVWILVTLLNCYSALQVTSSESLRVEIEEEQSKSQSLENSITNQYVVTSIKEEIDRTVVFAKYTGSSVFHGKAASKIAKNINITIQYYSDIHFQIHIVNIENPQWEMPYEDPFPGEIKYVGTTVNRQYEVEVQVEPLNFVVRRKSTKEIIFSTTSTSLIISSLYNEIGTFLPTNRLYGLGERVTQFRLKNGQYSLWAKDKPCTIDNGQYGNKQNYGAHYVYLAQEKSRNFYISYLRTTAGGDAWIDYNSLIYRLVGGLLNLLFFIGNTDPEYTTKLYHEYIKGYQITPFWAMGFHQSRWGYDNLSVIQEVARNYKENDLPLDTFWSDIDYMVDKIDFTIDNKKYPPQEFQQFLKEYDLRFVPIIDAGIAIQPTDAYLKGLYYDVFIKNAKGENLIGKVWPGETHYVDFFHPNASKYWKEQFEEFYKILPFSGIWLDMNEQSNFGVGEFNTLNPNTGDQDLPYLPGNALMSEKTLSINAKSYNGVTELYTHNIDNLMQQYTTRNIFDELAMKDVLLLSRSNAPGSGRYVTVWTGDNGSTFEFLLLSISQLFSYGLYAIPMTGADICGFSFNTTSELCARWFQLGAFYPFSRNHNEQNAISQEPYVLGEDVLLTARVSLKTRYSLLKWYYSLFVASKGLGTVFRPLIWQYATDDKVYEDYITNTQILLSNVLMLTPVVESGIDTIYPYFPKDTWYSYRTGEVIQNLIDEPTKKKIYAPLRDNLPIFQRGGTIIFNQSTEGVTRIKHLDNQFNLVIALSAPNSDGIYTASGQFLSINEYTNHQLIIDCTHTNTISCFLNIDVTLKVEQNQINVNLSFSNSNSETLVVQENYVNKLIIYGVQSIDSEIIHSVSSNLKDKPQAHIQRINESSNLIIDYQDQPINVQNNLQIDLMVSI